MFVRIANSEDPDQTAFFKNSLIRVLLTVGVNIEICTSKPILTEDYLLMQKMIFSTIKSYLSESA